MSRLIDLPPETPEERADYASAGDLAREEPLRKAARAFLASVAAAAIGLKRKTSPRAVRLAAQTLIDIAADLAEGKAKASSDRAKVD